MWYTVNDKWFSYMLENDCADADQSYAAVSMIAFHQLLWEICIQGVMSDCVIDLSHFIAVILLYVNAMLKNKMPPFKR